MALKKPKRLHKGECIATISPSFGWAGDPGVRWKYEFGKRRLEELFGLQVHATPNSMRGSVYLNDNPRARAEDILWAFENKNIKAVISNMGGNDSLTLLPYLDQNVIRDNPKIFIGFSDIMHLHLFSFAAGLSTFYGHNLLSTIAETQGLHPYTEKFFFDCLFQPEPLGRIEPSPDWTHEADDYYDFKHQRTYYPNPGYELIQGSGTVRGNLFGGHTGIREFMAASPELTRKDFENAILFLEDISEFFTAKYISDFFHWLGSEGLLQAVNGIIIGKHNSIVGFDEQKRIIKTIVSDAFGEKDLPILYGLNFGHSSPIFILPYGALAEINCDLKTFSILESGVS